MNGELEDPLHGHGARVSLWPLATLVALVFGSASFNWVYHMRVVDRLNRIEIKQDQEIETMLTTKWMSEGKERSWTSTLGEHDPSETIRQLTVRHKAELDTLYEAFPEDRETEMDEEMDQ